MLSKSRSGSEIGRARAVLAHLGERQTEVHFGRSCAVSGGTVFDPQRRHNFLRFAGLTDVCESFSWVERLRSIATYTMV